MTVGDLCGRLGYREMVDWVIYEQGGFGPPMLAQMSKEEIGAILGNGT